MSVVPCDPTPTHAGHGRRPPPPMTTMVSNWSGNVHQERRAVHRPQSPQELRDVLLAHAGVPVAALGTRHSQTLPDVSVYISMLDMRGISGYDPQRGCVTVVYPPDAHSHPDPDLRDGQGLTVVAWQPLPPSCRPDWVKPWIRNPVTGFAVVPLLTA